MKQRAFMLALLGLVCCAIGTQTGRWGWLLIWFGADLLILAFAYLSRSHRVFGKRPNGTLPFWSWGLFFPFLVYTSIVWNSVRLLIREPACNQVSDKLAVGRRLLDAELPVDFANYVDLTAEFQETRRARQSPAYLSFPVLDAGAPDPETLRKMIVLLKPGKTLVHCAQGHGRTGLFALAFLLATQRVASIDE